ASYLRICLSDGEHSPRTEPHEHCGQQKAQLRLILYSRAALSATIICVSCGERLQRPVLPRTLSSAATEGRCADSQMTITSCLLRTPPPNLSASSQTGKWHRPAA